ALALRSPDGLVGTTETLRRIGEALAAGSDLERAARQAAREAADATGARRAAVWRSSGEGLDLVARVGRLEGPQLQRAGALAADARSTWQPPLVEHDPSDGS